MRLHHGRSRRARIDLGQWPRSQTSTLRHGQATDDRKMSSRRVGGRFNRLRNVARTAAHRKSALRDMRAGARRDFTCLGPSRISPRAWKHGRPSRTNCGSFGRIRFCATSWLRGSRLIPRGRDLQLACISQCALPARDCPRKAGEIRLTTTAIPEKLPAIRGK